MNFTTIWALSALALVIHSNPIDSVDQVKKKTVSAVLRKNTQDNKVKWEEDPEPKDTPTFSSKIELVSPVSGKFVVLKKFTPNFNKPFRGLLIKAGSNSKILASFEGTVIAIEKLEGYEYMIVLEHPNDYLTIYANLGEVLVKEGERVQKGMELGMTLNEKNLYFQVNRGDRSIDPINYILSEK